MSGAMTQLWCFHVPGPDELHAQVDRAAAEAAAKLHNELVRRYLEAYPRTENDPPEAALTAVVIPWPWSAEAHARNLRDVTRRLGA